MNYLYRLWSRFLTGFGNVMVSFDEPRVNYGMVRILFSKVQTGDILCRRYHSYLDSKFIKGKYTHSGVVVNREAMIHSIAEGVNWIDIGDFVLHTDGFILLRPKAIINLDRGLDFVKSCVGTPYDFLFKRNNKALYCHELSFEYLNKLSSVQEHSSIIYYEDLLKRCDVIYEA